MTYFLDTYIRYEIAGGNIGETFSIDPDTGDVSLAKSLDYETRKQVRPDEYYILFLYKLFKRI